MLSNLSISAWNINGIKRRFFTNSYNFCQKRSKLSNQSFATKGQKPGSLYSVYSELQGSDPSKTFWRGKIEQQKESIKDKKV
jgi:hypothetical protein